MVTLLFLILVTILIIFYGSYYLFGIFYGRHIRHQYKKNAYLPKVSLVVATYNEEGLIKKKIENILSLDYPKDLMEVIFVDSSTDNTRKIIKEFKEHSPLKIVLVEEEKRKGLASALNLGYEKATGDIIIKSDCDIPLKENAIKEIVKYFSDPKVGAVSGRVVVSNPSGLEMGYRTIFERLRLAEANLDSTYLFNPFCAFRKELIEPIDAKSVADDAELALKIRKKGYQTVYSPEAIAYESSPVSISERIKQKSRRAQGHIRLIFQNLDVLFNPKYGKFGIVIFPANFFMMILSPWLILAALILGLVSAGIIFGNLVMATLSALALVIVVFVYLTSKPMILAGFIEAQINLIIGFFKLVVKGPEFIWSKNSR
ncbi:MAG: glycosyltransferase [Nitrososphaerota archaeon]